MSDTQSAMAYAIEAHGAQLRKYTGAPYWSHLAEVAGIVASLPYATQSMVQAAWLHDVVEDTPVSIDEVEHLFGREVAAMVAGLTEFSKGRNDSREYRKFLDSMFLAEMLPVVQTIKMADMISNTASIAKFDPAFAKSKYLFEIERRMTLLTKADPDLSARLQALIADAKSGLGMDENDTDSWLQKQPEALLDHDAEAIAGASRLINQALQSKSAMHI